MTAKSNVQTPRRIGRRGTRSGWTCAWLAVAALTCAAATAPLADETKQPGRLRPLRKVAFDATALKAWGTRTFTYVLEDEEGPHELGTVTLDTKVTDTGVTLHDVWKLRWKERDISLDVELDCAPEIFMRPESIVAEGSGSGDSGTFTAKVGEVSADVTFMDKSTKRIDIPPNTLTDMALFRVFTMLPRAEGAEFFVARLLEASELNLKGAGFIKAVGPDPITVGGKQEALFKFTYSRNDRVIVEAWIDGTGACRQLRLNKRKTLVEKHAEPTGE